MSLREISTSGDRKHPHVALLPSAGMGHLAPFLRLAVALVQRGCEVTFITINSMVSSTESRQITAFFSSFPQIHPLEFRLAPFDSSSVAATDPFFLQWEAIRRSAHLLPHLLTSSSPPISALVIDITLASTFMSVSADLLRLPSYILFTSSAMMLALCAFLPTAKADKSTSSGVTDIDMPGLCTLPNTSIPPAFHNPANLFTAMFMESGRELLNSNGILINTFEAFEQETLSALNRGEVVPGLPPVIAIGPLQPLRFEGESRIAWLDAQPERSVVYVSFGSRTALSREQIKELGDGLERSGCRFLWVVKSKVVDRDEEEELEELLGDGFLGRIEDRGLVVKGWVDQEEILGHRAVGGFISHCGWNSVTEAALHGVRVLAWPRGGDQRVNAEIVGRSGLGIWVKEWSWEAEEGVVSGEVIGEHVKELMEDSELRVSATHVAEEALRAVAEGGSSDKVFAEFIDKLKV